MSAPHPYQWAVDGPPIGHWQTTSGTFEAAMQSHYVFRPDKTGHLYQGNAFGLDEPLPFDWEHISEGHLKLFLRYPNIAESEHAGDKLDEANWDNVRYKTGIIETDAGTFPVLRNVEPSELFYFHESAHPIRLISREPKLG